MTDATDKLTGLVPVVVATDVALRTSERVSKPRKKRKRKKKSKTNLLEKQIRDDPFYKPLV